MSGRFDIGACALRAAFIVVLVARIAAPGAAHADAAEAKRIFTTRCTACHTFGKGVKVGPDLKGVAERRQRAWIIKFVQSSSTVIASGDKTATDLLAQFNQMRMPDWVDLTDAQIGSIIDWLAANGPDQQDIDARLAESATLAEIESGRQHPRQRGRDRRFAGTRSHRYLLRVSGRRGDAVPATPVLSAISRVCQCSIPHT
jgi:cytochrome c2